MWERICTNVACMRDSGKYSKSYALEYVDCAKDMGLITSEEYNTIRESIQTSW